jgi:O-antigen ligase
LKDPHANKVKKVLAMGLMVSNLMGMVRSGSRGGLIGFAVLCLLFFLRSSPMAKIAMVVAAILTIAGAVVVMPNSLKIRYATLVSGSEAEQDARSRTDLTAVYSAESSSAERRRLLRASIDATLSHPLFGVGIGQFAVYEVRIDEAEGRNSGWQGTHNTYTQISSEAGFPALIAFVCMIIFSIEGCQALSKRIKKLPGSPEKATDMLDITFALTSSLIVYSMCICFDYIGYSATLPTLAGLVIALVRCGTSELDRLERAPASEQPGTILNFYPVGSARAPRPIVLQPASSPGRL